MKPDLSFLNPTEEKNCLEIYKSFSFQMKKVGLLISINRRPSAVNFSIRNLANSQIRQMDSEFRSVPKDFMQNDLVKKYASFSGDRLRSKNIFMFLVIMS